MATITVNANVSDALLNRIKSINNPTTMLALHNNLAKRCNPYVPMLEGPLSQTTVITPNYVRYLQPYAHYQYYGEVYGPSYPIKKHGEIVGWYSPPGQKKHPTGKKLKYTTDYHPLATSFWDKAMLRDHGDEFRRECEDIIIRRVEQYGR